MTTVTRNSIGAWSLMGVLIVAAGMAAGLQPEGDRAKVRERFQDRAGERPGERVGGERSWNRLPKDKDAAKASVKRQIEELDRRRERLVKIAERLDKGEEPATIESDMPETGVPGGGPRGPGVNQDSRREVLRMVREARPDLAVRLEDMAKSHPVGDALVWRMGPNPSELSRAKVEDPPLFNLRLDELEAGMVVVTHARTVADLALSGKAETPEGLEAKERLRTSVLVIYDIRQKVQESDIDALVKRVERLRSEFAQRAEKRVEAVNKLADEIVARFQRIEEARRRGDQKPASK